MRIRLRRFPALPLVLAILAPAVLTACEQDPYQRPGTWHVGNDNEHNLRVMLDNPGDLTHGRDAAGSRGAASANALGRLRQDKVKPLAGNLENFKVGGASAATGQP